MTNDYKKGHRYRMKTDSNYRKRHDGTIETVESPPSIMGTCNKCGLYKRLDYHHTPKGGYRVCKKCHGLLHRDRVRKTPRKG